MAYCWRIGKKKFGTITFLYLVFLISSDKKIEIYIKITKKKRTEKIKGKRWTVFLTPASQICHKQKSNKKTPLKKGREIKYLLVGPPGLEPGTKGL